MALVCVVGLPGLMASMSMPSGTPRWYMASLTSTAHSTDESGEAGVGSLEMSSGAPSPGSDCVHSSWSSLPSASRCSIEASSFRQRVLLRTPLKASRVQLGVISTNRWLMFLTPNLRKIISAGAMIKSSP